MCLHLSKLLHTICMGVCERNAPSWLACSCPTEFNGALIPLPCSLPDAFMAVCRNIDCSPRWSESIHLSAHPAYSSMHENQALALRVNLPMPRQEDILAICIICVFLVPEVL